MRILHTADWHLGKLFYGNYLTEDQAYVLEQQFLPLLRDEGIDAVVLAGDVYDRSLPPAEAVELFDDIATKITADLKIPFLVISGNHDSPARLSFASRLLAPQGLYIAGELDRLTGPVVLEDEAGPVAFLTIPYAEPAVVRQVLGQETVRSHQQAMEAPLAWQVQSVPQGARTVCIAHAFVAGGVAGDSERPLSIGGTDQVTSSLFAPFTYTALGHLHGPQKVTSDTIRYAGSLLKYSFGEARQHKGAVIADIGADGQVDLTFRDTMCASSAVLSRPSWPPMTTGRTISSWPDWTIRSPSSTAWPNCGASIPTPWPWKCPTATPRPPASATLICSR